MLWDVSNLPICLSSDGLAEYKAAMEQESVYVVCHQANVTRCGVIEGAGDKSLYTRAVILGLGYTWDHCWTRTQMPALEPPSTWNGFQTHRKIHRLPEFPAKLSFTWWGRCPNQGGLRAITRSQTRVHPGILPTKNTTCFLEREKAR